MAKKILLPLDHADPKTWKQALPVAMEQAKFYGADLRAVTVIPEIIRLPNLPADYGTHAAEHVHKHMSEELEKAGAGDIELVVRQGSVYREILKLAHKGGFDMIVIASAKGDFPNYEIGPNLARVVRHAHCTVMVVRS